VRKSNPSFFKFSIPASVASIGNYAFYSSNALNAIDVADANQVYSSENGVLYNKTKTSIIKYPMGKRQDSFSIPASVTLIESYAFTDASSLTSVYFAGNAPTIGQSGAFNSSGPKVYITEVAAGFGVEGGTWNDLTVVVVRPKPVVITTPSVTQNPTASTPVTTAAPAPKPAVKLPTMKLKQKLSSTVLAKQIKMTVPAKAVVTLTVAKSSKNICKVVAGKLVALKKGKCSVTVAVTPAKTKAVKKPKTTKKSTVVAIS
jgi:hypothetical protein